MDKCPYCGVKMTHPNLTKHYCSKMVDNLVQMLRDVEKDIAHNRVGSMGLTHRLIKDELKKINMVKGYEDI